MLFHTVTNASVRHCDGNITNGLTEVASVTVLNAVSVIHTNGTIIMIENMIRMR